MEDRNLTAITHTDTPAGQNSSLFTGELVYMPRARCKVPRVLENYRLFSMILPQIS